MINQFNNWTNIKRDNVCIIKSYELFENNIVDKLENFLEKKIDHFPISYNNPKTSIESIESIEIVELFEKYKLEIDRINNCVI
jgi:capsid portal protein